MTARLPLLKPKQILKALQRAVFFTHHTTGSHYILKHSVQLELRITVPYHEKDISRGILKSIIKQARLTPEQFLDLL